jgi:hypothetical protein
MKLLPPFKGFLAGLAATLWAALPLAAEAEPLTVVEVGAPAINCVFNADCRVTVSDSIGALALPYIATPGTAWLQSRTFAAQPGTPGAGTTAYEYRLSLTQASGSAECMGGLVLNFGPVTKLPYKNGALADVYVVTAGGLGTIGLKSAETFGNVIVFEFSKPLCLAGPPNDANTTFFFGLAAAAAPMAAKAHVFATGETPSYEVDARVPAH